MKLLSGEGTLEISVFTEVDRKEREIENEGVGRRRDRSEHSLQEFTSHS